MPIPPQGIKWITNREGPNGLVVLQQGQPKYVDKVLAAIEQVGDGLWGRGWPAQWRLGRLLTAGVHRCAASSVSHCRRELGLLPAVDPRCRCGPRPQPGCQGAPLLLENLPMELDAVLDPVLAKRTIKRGRALVMKVGDTEVDYDPGFRWAARGGGMRIPRQTAAIINIQKLRDERKCRVHRIGRHSVRPNILSTSHRPLDRLYLQTKLSNPHYKPEIAAQCTLVNFCVTEKVRAGVPHGPCIHRAWPAGPCRQDASRGRATPRCLRPCASSPSPSCSL